MFLNHMKDKLPHANGTVVKLPAIEVFDLGKKLRCMLLVRFKEPGFWELFDTDLKVKEYLKDPSKFAVVAALIVALYLKLIIVHCFLDSTAS